MEQIWSSRDIGGQVHVIIDLVVIPNNSFQSKASRLGENAEFIPSTFIKLFCTVYIILSRISLWITEMIYFEVMEITFQLCCNIAISGHNVAWWYGLMADVNLCLELCRVRMSILTELSPNGPQLMKLRYWEIVEHQ